jgi:hypothetical protein
MTKKQQRMDDTKMQKTNTLKRSNLLIDAHKRAKMSQHDKLMQTKKKMQINSPSGLLFMPKE